MAGISYDDSGSLASYFGVTCLTLFLIPWTFLSLRPKKKHTSKPLCPCPECRQSPARIDKLKKSSRRSSGIKRVFLLLAAWTFLGYLIYNLAIAPKAQGGTVYNPFEILGLSSASTEKQIKKHYKKLSLQFHPDKLKLAENQTQEEAEEKYIEITKAYKSLTDEVTRENLAKYGNPDGPQQREDKIAIPKWIVEGNNGILVLAVYGIVLGGGIPWIVGRWWFTQRRLTRDNILNATADIFFQHLKEDTDFTNLIAIIAASLEVAAVVGGSKVDKKTKKAKQSKVEELEETITKVKAENFIQEDPIMRKSSRVPVTSGADRRARALIWAHLLRIEITDSEMRVDQLAVLRVLPPLLNALNNISQTRSWLGVSLRCIELQPALVQAVPAGVYPLAQLPGISFEKAFEEQVVRKAEGDLWLEKWVSSREGHDEAFEVAKYWPRLEVVDAEYKVEDSKVITPSSICNLVVKLRYVYPTTPLSARAKPIQMLPPSERPQGAKVDDDVASIEAAVKEASENGTPSVKDVKEKVAKQAAPAVNGFAHTPRWPQLRKPQWFLLLGDSKINKVMVPPIKITDIPLPKEDGTPGETKEFKLQFQAMPVVNLYSFVVHLRSDTFLGGDVQVPLMLKVEEAPLESDSDYEGDDISEPDEDTLAGQMAMMRGDKVKPSKVHGQYDSDSESDLDDDQGDESESESEGEVDGDPRRGKAYNVDTSDSE
ncbi:translocation protein SEC63 [Cryptococcus wingfieldii CBS 7118]|uniref:Translocation protein SEC63 n=1 Tax=Cryptococcus wingfieldii CBS 7118 TaxID=1295528 RepID=A0A1E3K2N1_9TREE|nr:translocation protein SEC63 [Cryptococcus wingfieldii CBS 7118]ODO07438.1 translocation protein SEC63 [Cryptococcus wingfieldii CBS 7118]